MGFWNKIIINDECAITIRASVMLVVVTGLNACVSADSPNALQLERGSSETKQNPATIDQSGAQIVSSDFGKQLLLPTVEGTLISVPQSSPLKSAGNQLALTKQTTTSNSRSIERINENTDGNAKLDNNQAILSQNTEIIEQPVIAKDAPRKKTGLLSLLFKRQAKKNVAINEPVAAVEIIEPETRVDSVVIPKLRPDQSNELAVAKQSDIEPNLSSEYITNNGQIAENLNKPKPPSAQQTRKKPGFFAMLLQRNKKNIKTITKPTDDRHNSILLSSRTSSRANRVTATPITAGLANITNVINNNNQSVQMASAAGLSRNPINGIATQHSGVNVDCITPGVVRILQYVEQRYGIQPVVSSGYRSPSRNRRAGGARNSMHIYCRAVDIQVKGVSKWHLAKFLRTVPGRGGVGTYCRTKSVHIDTGPKRDWHYSCRRKSKRKRKS